MILVQKSVLARTSPGVSPSSGCGIGSCVVPRPSLADHVIGTGATRGQPPPEGLGGQSWLRSGERGAREDNHAEGGEETARSQARWWSPCHSTVAELLYLLTVTRGVGDDRVDAHRFGAARLVVETEVVEREAREIFWPRPAHPLRRRTCSGDLAWAGRRLHSASFEAPSVSEFLDRLGASRLARKASQSATSGRDCFPGDHPALRLKRWERVPRRLARAFVSP
jgi:hypothetical protein